MAIDTLFRSALEALPEGLLLYAADGKVAFVNRRFLQLFDLNREEVEGLARAAIDGLLTRQGAAEKDGLLHAPTGEHLQRQRLPLPAGGELETFREVGAPRHDAEEREQLLSVATHDLRAPLANVRSYAGLLLGGRIELEPRVKRAAEVIARNADKALRLVQLYFDSMRAEAGKMPIHREPVSLGPVLAEQVASRRSLAAEKGVRLSDAISDKLPNVEVDRDRLSNVLGTFLDNALFRAPANGTVEVVAEERGGKLWCGFTEAGDVIPAAEARLAFDRDHQVLKERRLGHGFALAVARTTAQAHGGDAGVISGPGKTTFWLTLPV